MRVKSIVVFVVCMGVAVSFSGQALAQSAKPIELAFAHQLPPVHFMNKKVIEPWAKEVEERCGGKIKINIYPAESLLKAKDTYEGIVRGMADLAWGLHHVTPGRFPLTEVMHLPFVLPSMQAINDAFEQLFEKRLKAEYKDVKVLWLSGAPLNQLLTSKKAVRTLQDLKGLAITCEGPLVPAVKAVGASPTQVPPPELYSSLQLGVIGGTISPYAGILAYRLQEVAKYLTVADVNSITTFAVMNLQKWNSLPADVRKVIEECSGIGLYNRKWSKVQLEADTDAQGALQKAGVEFIRLPPAERDAWRKISQGSYERWLEGVKAKGLPGKEVLDEVNQIAAKSGK
jgi:TRAP-type transport system periplasmic protein